PANPQAHYEHTGPEILRDAGNVDVFVAGVGTGGTLTGIGHYLREHNPNVKLFAIEPAESPVLTQQRNGEPLAPGSHGIQGIGAGFIPKVLDVGILDGVVTVSTDQAVEWARRAARDAGVFVGISSGAAICAAEHLAATAEFAGKTIVTVLPSYGERYLSSPLFSHLGE
ncbi:MAG: pyridoxal-phosphate dependent enzyme, partial [Phycisphaerales bacterium]|nr:pyridoxal-phosphate dependent enzyme [Phycisphaerales bacterium]